MCSCMCMACKLALIRGKSPRFGGGEGGEGGLYVMGCGESVLYFDFGGSPVCSFI